VPVIRRLNLTSFKLLAWSIDEKTSLERYGLKAKYIGQLALKTWGPENHTVFFFKKDVKSKE
jgi:hypothetical protein